MGNDTVNICTFRTIFVIKTKTKTNAMVTDFCVLVFYVDIEIKFKANTFQADHHLQEYLFNFLCYVI